MHHAKPRVAFSFNVRAGLDIALALQPHADLCNFNGIYFSARSIGDLPGPANPLGRLAARHDASRVKRELSSLPYRRLIMPELILHGPRLLRLPVSLARRLQFSETYFDYRTVGRANSAQIFHAASGIGLRTAQRAKASGAKYICHQRALHYRTEQSATEEHLDYEHPETHLAKRLDQEYELADLILCNSELTATSFLKQGYPKHKIHVQHNAVDLSFFRPSSDARPDLPPFKSILFVGTLDRRKGLDLLLDAVARNHTEPTLKIVGPRTADETLFRRVMNQPRVMYLGSLDRNGVRREMQHADALVLPSRADAFGYVVIEAIACGTPVVVSDAVGASEIVRQTGAGVIHRSDDSYDLEAKLAQINAESLFTFRNACVTSRHDFGWSEYGLKLAALYAQILGSRARTTEGGSL